MKAVVFHGIGDIRLEDVQEPTLEQPTDAIVRITASAICGTDLHFVRGTCTGLEPGTVLGHEAVGVVEQVGPEVRNLQPGDRVVIPSTIGCGPAAQAASQQEQQFRQELQKVAPEQHPDGDNWHPGDGPSQVQRWAVEALAKAGILSIIGVYPQTDDTFPIGLAMNKNLTIKMGNCNHRKYIPRLLDLVSSRIFDPRTLITRQEGLVSAVDAYRAFDTRQPGWLKVELLPGQELPSSG